MSRKHLEVTVYKVLHWFSCVCTENSRAILLVPLLLLSVEACKQIRWLWLACVGMFILVFGQTWMTKKKTPLYRFWWAFSILFLTLIYVWEVCVHTKNLFKCMHPFYQFISSFKMDGFQSPPFFFFGTHLYSEFAGSCVYHCCLVMAPWVPICRPLFIFVIFPSDRRGNKICLSFKNQDELPFVFWTALGSSHENTRQNREFSLNTPGNNMLPWSYLSGLLYGFPLLNVSKHSEINNGK